MNEITTLFTAIGDFFRSSDWYQLVKWPFWTMLFTVAAGGVYCARFGKKTLINQGVIGTLNLITIYFGAVMLYLYLPPVRDLFSELPFLSVNDTGITLLDPFTLASRDVWPLLLRLMLLLLMVNLVDSFSTGGKTLISWLFVQLICALISLVAYKILTAGLSLIFPRLLNRYAMFPVLTFVIVGLLVLCFKFIFTVIISEGNPYFSSVYRFFTVNKGGSLFTISSLSFLFFLVVLSVMHATDNTTLTFETVNTTSLWIILGLMMAALYIFSMFYHDRKKA